MSEKTTIRCQGHANIGRCTEPATHKWTYTGTLLHVNLDGSRVVLETPFYHFGCERHPYIPPPFSLVTPELSVGPVTEADLALHAKLKEVMAELFKKEGITE